jgi:hypothetical protein
MVIAQAVEHQGNQFAGGGDDTDVAAVPGADTVADLTVAGMRTGAVALRRWASSPPTKTGSPALRHVGKP